MAPFYEHRIPCELIRKILTCVFAESVHSVCLSPTATSWELNVASNISSVSFAFNEIMKEIVIKVFEIVPGEDGKSVLSIVHEHLIYLKDLGAKCREPFRPLPIVRLPESTQVSHLIQAYTLYLAANVLRLNASQSIVTPTFMSAHCSISCALTLCRQICQRVQPTGMADLLAQTVEQEITLVETATNLVQARVDLHGSLDKMAAALDERSTDEEKLYSRDSIKADIHENLRRVERADVFNYNHRSPLVIDEYYRTFQLADLVDTIGRCRFLPLDLDEYDILQRANLLVDSWDSIILAISS